MIAGRPIALPRAWLDRVDRPETSAELALLRNSVQRGAPFGGPESSAHAAAKRGLEAALHPRGRRRKAES